MNSFRNFSGKRDGVRCIKEFEQHEWLPWVISLLSITRVVLSLAKPLSSGEAERAKANSWNQKSTVLQNDELTYCSDFDDFDDGKNYTAGQAKGVGAVRSMYDHGCVVRNFVLSDACCHKSEG